MSDYLVKSQQANPALLLASAVYFNQCWDLLLLCLHSLEEEAGVPVPFLYKLDMRANNHTLYWTYQGQPRSEWPDWLLFTNHASNIENTLLIIHVLDGPLRLDLGDTLVRRTDGYMSVRKGPRNK